MVVYVRSSYLTLLQCQVGLANLTLLLPISCIVVVYSLCKAAEVAI